MGGTHRRLLQSACHIRCRSRRVCVRSRLARVGDCEAGGTAGAGLWRGRHNAATGVRHEHARAGASCTARTCTAPARHGAAHEVTRFAAAMVAARGFPSSSSYRIMRAGRATALSQLYDSQRSEASRPRAPVPQGSGLAVFSWARARCGVSAAGSRAVRASGTRPGTRSAPRAASGTRRTRPA